MELFHEYYSSQCQFALDLLACSKNRDAFSRKELEDLYAGNISKELFADVLDELILRGLIVKSGGACRMPEGFRPMCAPLPALERAYLKYLCQTTEAPLFLDAETLAQITRDCGDADEGIFLEILRPAPPPAPDIDPRIFRTLLRAITEGRQVSYRYHTQSSSAQKIARGAVPFRLEHSVLDGRWWLLSYSPAEDRPIKSRLENLTHAALEEPHRMTEEALRAIIKRKLAPERAVLRIAPIKNALERTFLTFENALDMDAHMAEDGSVEMSFRWFEFDAKDIIKKLLYLGEAVELTGPAPLRQLMREKLEECLKPRPQGV